MKKSFSSFQVKWKKESKTFVFETQNHTLGEFKDHVQALFGLEGLKLVGFKGKSQPDSTRLIALKKVASSSFEDEEAAQRSGKAIKLMALGAKSAELSGLREREVKFEVEQVAEQLRLEEARKGR